MSRKLFSSSPASAHAGFEPTTLIELLRWRSRLQPDRLAYTFLADGETEEATLTYGELDARARAVAARLQSLGAAGERVLLLYPPGLEYVIAFFGCVYAGAVAVPTYPPRPNRSLSRLQTIVEDARASVTLTISPLLARLAAAPAELGALKSKWLATDDIPTIEAEQWREPPVDGSTLAFLQYTSGSTATPRGVMVTHGNLLHNERMIQAACEHTEESTFVGWLPLYHDMGLIGNVLQPLYIGASCVLMSPVSFLQRPFCWLQAISRYRGATSGGPNFAYELCVRKITPAERETLDLSCWRTAFNGAEPIRRETIERFADVFAACGFRRETFFPCYGLAEATLIVTGGPKHAPLAVGRFAAAELEQNRVVPDTPNGAHARTLVSSGRVILDQEIAIVDPELLTRCAPDRVGEIWVAGQSVAQGYWGRPVETEETFYARPRDGGADPFLRTGDLGFLKDGELFVTGRLKDLIIVRGHNHYPQDIEQTVERVSAALRPGCGAAFSVEASDEERLVVVQEVDRRKQVDYAVVIDLIRQVISEEHELRAHTIVLIEPGSIPKTSSGKIQRGACRAKLLAGTLEVVHEWSEPVILESEPVPARSAAANVQTVEAVEAWLCSLLAGKLRLDPAKIDARRPLSHFGLDSLAAVELAHSIETGLGARLSMAALLQDTGVAALAREVWSRLGTGEDLSATPELDEVATGDDAVCPLSYGQQGLWFLHQMNPDDAAYTIAGAARLKGAVDVGALQRAFQGLVNRHATLRTTFSAVDGKPVQQVHESVEVCFEIEDAAAWAEVVLHERLAEAAYRPFDLAHGPLFRVTLFTTDQEHILLLAVHHIVADFWSLAVLLHELGALYGSEKNGAPHRLASLTQRYGDYVRWQQRMLAGQEWERSWLYWKQQLTDVPALQLQRARDRQQSARGSSHFFRLDQEITQNLNTLARAHSATLYMVLLAAFEALLYRYTGQEHLLIGSPTSGRSRAEFKDIVGYFVNPVILRATPEAHAGFADLLRQVKQNVLAAFEHQDYPFTCLVERLQPDRNRDYSPLFQVMFVFQKAQRLDDEGLGLFALGEAGAQLRVGELTFESMALEQRASQFDLTLMMAEAQGQLFGSLQYNTDVYTGEEMEQLAAHYGRLLSGVCASPTLPLRSLPLLSEEELRRQLVDWNATACSYDRSGCVHELFVAQAARTPLATAVVDGERCVSYEELLAQARRVAGRLRARGVGAEVLVGVCAERSVEMLAGLLGVLLSGGAYVPLDPAYPAERLRWMAEDAGLRVVLTGADGPARAQVEALVGTAEVWSITALLAGADEAGKVESVEGGVGPENAAYVLYTSGSTGRPKGVVIEHRSAVAFLHWAQGSFGPEACAGMLAATSICFDLSVFELFLPLSCGGTIILAENALHLPALAAAGKVTLINTVPSVMAELLREGIPESVRTINLAGEALPAKLVQQLYQRPHLKEVFNLYGPTEYTTYTTWELMAREKGEPILIGRPIANTQVYLLDEQLQPLPVGSTGEIFIGGEGLARGYLGRAALTAERFIPHPFAAAPGQRLYRSGDLGRYLGDGRLEHLGRADQQVKLRGFRIELGEIEAVLRRQEGVQEVAVAVQQTAVGDSRLVAYVAGNEASPVAVSSLQGYAQQHLPAYMVPGVWVLLERLPQTPNGKLDRRALPALEPLQARSEAPSPPRTPVEEVLAGVWSEVLGVEAVGVSEDFFALGGHSLLVTQVAARVRAAFNVDLPLRVLFSAPTIEKMAEQVEAALRKDGTLNVPPPERRMREGSVPASFAQQRLWFLDQLEPGAVYNLPAALHLSGPLNITALQKSLTEIMRRHEALRTTFAASEGHPVQVIHAAEEVGLPLIDLSSLTEAERAVQVAQLSRANACQPFDLAQGPLLRVALLLLDSEQHVLLLNVHHIVSDAWSIDVLFRELSTLYRAFCDDAPCPLEELPIQYSDFALWQREWLQGTPVDDHLAYWREQLDSAPALLELPTGKARPAVQTSNGALEVVRLPAHLSKDVRALAQQESVTLFMVLLAAFQALLYRYTGQPDIVVGTPVANRNRVETEKLIGFFANTLVLRTLLHGEISFRELLRRVREMSLDAYTYQDLPFEQLVEAIQPERNLSYPPLFQVMFALQTDPARKLELKGLSVDVQELATGTSKFDLSLTITDTGSELIARFEYNTDVYRADGMEQLAAHYGRLLSGVCASPTLPLRSLPLLSEEELRRQLVDWNATACSYDRSGCVHELFVAQAARTPLATAVVDGERCVSYEELLAQARRVAGRLRARGVGAEVLVGVCAERSVEMLAGLLGVLLSGGAYVPLDPAYPAERLRWMAEDAGLRVVLTGADGPARAQVEALVGTAEVWSITALLAGADEAGKVESVEGGVGPENAAYVLYTSGSTGRPKGVVIEHRSAVAFLHWAQGSFGPEACAGMLAATSICFDLSVFELFLPLSCGGTIILAENALHLPALAAAGKVTLINTVPSVMAELLREGIPESVRTINLAGEALPAKLVQQLYQRPHLKEVFNLYGPTEYTTYTTWELMAREKGEPILIGRPIANTQVYLLDEQLQPLPVGSTGEIFIGGEGLARGYLGRAALTAERFIPHPFAAAPGQRLYRSGDLGRYLGDGRLEHLGRADQQVKLRGFRIELGEIEAVLRRQEGVQEVAVAVQQTAVGDSRLVAYVAGNEASPVAVSSLQGYAQQHLPAYMVPGVWVLLERLPQTPNGKLDRRALPAPEPLQARPEAPSPPRTPVEEVLAGIWSEVLGVEAVGVSEDFFALGGHSLLVTQVAARVRAAFSVDLPLRTFFEHRTIAAAAEVIAKSVDNDSVFEAPAIVALPREQFRNDRWRSEAVSGPYE